MKSISNAPIVLFAQYRP